MHNLDLRKSGSLSIEDSKRISFLAEAVGIEYNKYIGEIIEINNIEGIQFILRIVCRNTYMSKIYDRMCRLALLEDRLKNGEIYTSIITDSNKMKSPIRTLLNKYHSNAKLKVVDSQLSKFSFIYPLYSIIRNLYICINLWIWPKFIRFNQNPVDDIYILDTFIFKDSFDKNLKFNDRYYLDLIHNLDSNKRNKIWYLPTLNVLQYPWEWLKLFRQIAQSKENIMLKENWLKSSDYISSFLQSITLGNAIKVIPEWRGINISGLVSEEVFLERGSFSITQALLIYHFFKRIKNKGVKVNGVIDWYENQNIDRALYLGLRENYPNTKIKGYLGFVPQNYYLCLWPLKYELKGRVLPDEILVIGQKYISSIKKFLPEMKVSVAPAFRFKNTMKYSHTSNKNKNIILLAMPMIIDEARNIINIALKVNRYKEYKWLIKVHPTISQSQFKNKIPESINSQFKFIDKKNITELFHETHLLVTTASSTCIEALVCGVPVSIIGNRSGPTINPLVGVVDQKYWSVSYTSIDLEKNIDKAYLKYELNSDSLFLKVSQEKVREMMKF